jgi:hypothetical protein
MLRIFYTIQRLRSGLNPQTREPEASMRTTRPPKPSIGTVTTEPIVFPRKQFKSVGSDSFRFEIYLFMTISGYRNVTTSSIWGKGGANNFLLYIGHVGNILQLQKEQY